MQTRYWWEVPGHLDVRNGDLHIDGYGVRAILESFYPLHMGERPVFVYSTSWLRKNAGDMKSALTGADVFYAGKALGLPEIVRAAGEEGLGFDAVSPTEVELALRMGISPENMMMTCEASELAMAYAAKNGVAINMNSRAMLSDYEKLVKAHPDYMPSRIMLRRGSRQEGAGWIDDNTTIGPHCKFGIAEEALVGKARRAKRHGLNIVGFQQHIGSGYGPESYGIFLRHAQRLAELTGEALDAGVELDTIDYGGGFGIRYREDQELLDVGKLHGDVMEMQERVLPGKNLRIIYEPGRRISDCGIMLMRVARTGKEYIPFIRTTAGFVHFPRPAMYGAYHEIVPVVETGRPPKREAQIAGSVCESGDVLTGGKHKLRMMPDVRKGEWLALLGIPYGRMMGMHDYCLFPPPVDLIVDEDGVHQAEPIGDFIKRDHPAYLDALK